MIQLSKMLNLPNIIQNQKEEVISTLLNIHTNKCIDFKIKEMLVNSVT